jgi:hypothetical protein
MPTPPTSRWLLFFAVLAVLGVAALTIPIVYNLRIQLRPEEVAAARQRWQREAPADYDLKLLVKTTTADGERDDAYDLVVRAGRPRLLGSNGSLLYVDPSLAVVLGTGVLTLPQEDVRLYGIDALFAQMEKDLREDAAGSGRNYATAVFSPVDGHPTRYVHRLHGTRNRIEWLIRLDRIQGERNGP